jgi:hypothetical protein
LNHYFIRRKFKYGIVAKFLGYVGTKAVPLCAEFYKLFNLLNNAGEIGTLFFENVLPVYCYNDYTKVSLRSKDAFVITCIVNLTEVKVLYVQQDLRYEISSYWRLNV